MTVDLSGNVYVTGRSANVGLCVYTAIKYEQIIIPVELMLFTASVNENNVMLSW